MGKLPDLFRLELLQFVFCAAGLPPLLPFNLPSDGHAATLPPSDYFPPPFTGNAAPAVEQATTFPPSAVQMNSSLTRTPSSVTSSESINITSSADLS